MGSEVGLMGFSYTYRLFIIGILFYLIGGVILMV
jgi:hypothetical protein